MFTILSLNQTSINDIITVIGPAYGPEKRSQSEVYYGSGSFDDDLFSKARLDL